MMVTAVSRDKHTTSSFLPLTVSDFKEKCN